MGYYNNKTEPSADRCYNIDEPQNHYAKWKRQTQKAEWLYLCECPEKADL